MRYQGKLIRWNDTKGIGTIAHHGSNDHVFVHISGFSHTSRRPIQGDIVVFEVEKEAIRGKLRAVQVSYPKRASASHKKSSSRGFVSVSFTALFVGQLLLGLITNYVSVSVLSIYAIASTITFVTYWLDKQAAKQDRWRIAESTLHLMALLCGWPGATLAQRLIHHKNAKRSFQRVFMLMMVLNIAGFLIYQSPDQIQAFLDWCANRYAYS